ncbi:MAG: hypothetical protein HY047_14120 [Acidobacteria bacterium]|nr:hypothetical protein [Acidobacteriota bacterium]
MTLLETTVDTEHTDERSRIGTVRESLGKNCWRIRARSRFRLGRRFAAPPH